MKDFSGNVVGETTKPRRRVKSNDPSGLDARANGLALAGGLAVSAFAASFAKAAPLADGYETLDPAMGVVSAQVQADGSLKLTLADGSVHSYAAGDFVVLQGGAIAVSAAVAEELTALADAAGGIGVAAGAAAGLLGALAVAGGGGSDAGASTAPVNQPAVIGGDTTGSVTEDSAATLEASGTLTVTDADAGQAVFVAQTSVAGSNGYGIFTLGTNGAWTYAADTTLAAIQALDDGQTLFDSFTAVTADGTSKTVTVTITGVDEAVIIAPVFLSDIQTGIGGFVINGASADDYSGVSVRSAGDVNGDGFEDLIVGAKQAGPNGINAGASYVVFGKTDGTAVELSDIAAGTGGFVINGASASDFSGFSVSSAGDVNGDGFDDLIVGAYGADPNRSYSGASYVVFGKTDGTAVELSAVKAGQGGFVMNGAFTFDFSGRSVSSAGDVNGDGLDDLIVGAWAADPHGSGSGASFVVFGKTDGTVVELSAIKAGTGGFVINGVSASDASGWSVSSAGDVNGDGFDDLIVGAINDDPNGSKSGASFVVFGKTNGAAVELSDIEAATGGFVINGVSALDYAGGTVSSAGDVNGDGFDDLIVGAFAADPNGTYSGASYVVFGKTDGTAVELSDIAAGSGGFVINGVSADDASGVSVSSAGDVNGDGLNDLIIGAYGADPNGTRSGASCVVFGKTDATAVELSDIQAGTGGFVINGVSANDKSGFSVSSAGDVNGDGFDDLIVGAGAADPNGANSGASFVVFGGDFSGAVTEVGTVGADTLTGSAARDVLVGGTGADVLAGAGGADVLYGGAGDDFLAVSDLDFARVDGGTGVDTLRLTGTGLSLDLDTLDNTALTSIEVIDLNAGGNTLTISPVELFRLAEGTNTLRVLGATGDAVTLTGDIWTRGPDLIEGATTFAVYTQGNARLEVAADVAVSGSLPIVVPAIELSDIKAGIGGFVINGAGAGDGSGRCVSSAGDVNGDGFDDLIVGAAFAHPNATAAGSSYVVFGKTDGTAVELSDIEAGSGGFVINGVSQNDHSGLSVSSAGDVNGDGLDDLIVGARDADPSGSGSGASYVVFGKTDATAVELSDVEAGSGGFVINGVSADDLSGWSVSSAGDVNGDGFDDLIVGAVNDDPNGSNSGASFVVFGKTDGTAVTLSDIEAGTGGFVINGVSAGDYSGGSVSSAGDVNGDGFDDLIVGARGADPNGNYSGASYVVFGKTDGTAVDLSAIEAGTGGFVINGGSQYDFSGTSVSSAGDVNGDGFDDLIVGASGAIPNGLFSGASYVVFGKTDGTAVELSAIEAGTGGFVINGASTHDFSSNSVSSAGDVNGDGFDDLIVGAVGADPNGTYSGASYVVFGKTDGTAVELSAIEAGTGGFVINGASMFDFTGFSVSAAGDVNGDGFDDLIVGNSSQSSPFGSSYVIFGGNFTGAATEVGTIGDDSLTGTAANDVIFAGTGDDTLDGGGGSDRLSGGAGADVFTLRNVDGTMHVVDFTFSDGDKLNVASLGYASFAEFQTHLSAEGPAGQDTKLTIDADTFVILDHIKLDDLVASHVTL